MKYSLDQYSSTPKINLSKDDHINIYNIFNNPSIIGLYILSCYANN